MNEEKRPHPAPTDPDAQSAAGQQARSGARGVRAMIYVLLAIVVVVALGWVARDWLWEQWRWYNYAEPYMRAQFRPHVLTAEAERALKPGQSFRECAGNVCPEMVVVPAGLFVMGSPESEAGHAAAEGPQHEVRFVRPLAVGKFEVTFEEWDACAAHGDCRAHVRDSGFGRGRQPVINATWDDAQRYAAWLGTMTGKPYRLLSEAEFEYAARAGTRTAYYWGDEIGNGHANCSVCGSQWDVRQPAPVGSFAANPFGLYDMLGNVSEWVEDCGHDTHQGAPPDGSAWTDGGNCKTRVARGGSWGMPAHDPRAAHREWSSPDEYGNLLGFRVGRALTP